MAKFFDARLLWAVGAALVVIAGLHFERDGLLFLGGYMLARVTR